MVANECDFEHEGFCVIPKIYEGFVCPSSKLTDGFLYCHGSNDELFTEEEYEEKFGAVIRGCLK